MFNEFLFGGQKIWLFQLGKAILRSMYLDHIIAHGTYHFYLALPLNSGSQMFTKLRGTSRTQEFKCNFVFLSTNCNVWNVGACNVPFQRYITRPKIIYIAVAKEKRKKFSRLGTAHQGGQKNHNGKTHVVLFRLVFLPMTTQSTSHM